VEDGGKMLDANANADVDVGGDG